jgi:putative DNA primase/helicase
MGAGKWKHADDSVLEGRNVAIIPDADTAGRKHALDVASRLHGRAREVRIVELPGAGKDASDWADAGGLADELRKLIEQATPFQPSADQPTDTPGFRLNDVGNGQRLAAEHGRELRHSAAFGWSIWDGRRWAEDSTHEIERRAKGAARTMYRAAAELDDDDKRAKLAKWAGASESAARIEAMIHLARSEPGIAIDARDFDRDPLLFNTENGTIAFDSESGEHVFRQHDPTDLITRLAPVKYDPAATCPTFERFLQETFQRDADLIEFAQRALGSCLVGLPEEVLHVLHGGGANGKTTLVNAVRAVLGEYMATMTPTFLAQQRSEAVQHEAMDLRGARLAVAHEPDRRMALDEAKAKLLSGRDAIKARRLYREHVEFHPTHTMFLVTNHRPRVQSQTVAIWRRVKLWPFDNVIPEDRRDPTLPDKLRAETPGILNWLIAGCAEWFAAGRDCDPPACVQDATVEYKHEEDIIGDWLDECTQRGPTQTAFKDLYESYEEWARGNGFEKPFSKKKLATLLEEHGFRRRTVHGQRVFEGLSVGWGDDG